MTIKASKKVGIGGGTAPFFNEPIVADQYFTDKCYGPSLNYGNWTNAALVADTVFVVPFVPKFDHTFTYIGVKNGSASQSGSKFSLGIFGDTGEGVPGDLISNYGEIVLDGSIALREISISQALVAKTIYWLAINSDSAVQVMGIENFNAASGTATRMLSTYGIEDYMLGNGNGDISYQKGFTYATGAPFPDPIVPAAPVSGPVPFIYLRG